MMAKAAKIPEAQQPMAETDYNLRGQRLGRKGQETRERILVAALNLIENQDTTITLSAVAREVSVRMPNLYRYFPDLGDLVLACLNRVMDSADVAFMDRLKERWPDEKLERAILDFLRAHYRFWHTHTRILHLRNSLADAGDRRFMIYRQQISRPLMEALALQMDVRPEDFELPQADGATVILTAFERTATVLTNAAYHIISWPKDVVDNEAYAERIIVAEAEIITLVVRHKRAFAEAHARCRTGPERRLPAHAGS